MSPKLLVLVPFTALAVALAAPPARAADTELLPPPESTERLLAPESTCPGQSNPNRPVRLQVRAMICLHRYVRRRTSRKRIYRVRRLTVSSRRKARDLRRCRQFSHSACGRDAFYWFSRVGFMRGNWGAGENLALGSAELGTARAAMRAWLHSPPHRKVLLTSRFRQLGVGMARGFYEGHRVQFWVAHFGYRS